MKLVVFDVDGTLVDSQAHIVDAMTIGLAAAGLPPLPHDEVLSIVGLSLPIAIATLLPDAAPEVRETVDRGYRAAYMGARTRGASPLYSGMAEGLAPLITNDRVLLGVATGKSRRGLTALLDAHGLTAAFVSTQCADDHPSKPHPAMLLAAVAEAGVAVTDAVMIGDTTFDMQMARDAGVAGWGVSWGYHSVQALRHTGVARMFDTVPDLFAGIDLWLDAPAESEAR